MTRDELLSGSSIYENAIKADKPWQRSRSLFVPQPSIYVNAIKTISHGKVAAVAPGGASQACPRRDSESLCTSAAHICQCNKDDKPLKRSWTIRVCGARPISKLVCIIRQRRHSVRMKIIFIQGFALTLVPSATSRVVSLLLTSCARSSTFNDRMSQADNLDVLGHSG